MTAMKVLDSATESIDKTISSHTCSVPAGHYTAQETLKNGLELSIRSIEPTDKPLLKEGMHHLSRQSLYFRFFTVKTELTDEELAYFTELDFIRHVGLIGSIYEVGQERPVGVARYIVSNKDLPVMTAELAFAVDECYQGIGVGSALFMHLIKIAKDSGLRSLYCYVMDTNIKMLALVRSCHLPATFTCTNDGAHEIHLSLNVAKEPTKEP